MALARHPLWAALGAALLLPALARGGGLGANEILARALDVDCWSLGDAEVSGHATVEEAGGATKVLGFTARARRYDGTLTKGIMRFQSPADLNGVAFLQIQKRDGDDDRFLFLPELHRARRIAGNTRSSAFMGTDFSYADIDRRDLRDAAATQRGDESIGRFPCYKLDVVPRGKDAVYARIELWVRKDNLVPLKLAMYARSGALVKTLQTQEIRRLSGRWFVTRSLMTDQQSGRSTELSIDKIVPRSDLPDSEFTVRNLEKG